MMLLTEGQMSDYQSHSCCFVLKEALANKGEDSDCSAASNRGVQYHYDKTLYRHRCDLLLLAVFNQS